MIINGRDYKINILILFMEDEVDVTVQAVETLLETIEDNVIISILFNGSSKKDLENPFASSPHIKYYESKDNLGVAGGRNFLLFTEECISSDIVMFIDNDVIPPVDYVRSLATFLTNRKDVGIVGSTLLNIRPFLFTNSCNVQTETGKFGNTIALINNREIKRFLLNTFGTSKFYHIGTNKDWFNAYFSSRDLLDDISILLGIKKRKDFYSQLKYDRRYAFEYLNKKCNYIPVGNVGGGAQAFFRRLIDEVGRLRDIFNPFGYEDVEFSIRVLKKGYKNYTDTNTFLLHGTDNRQEKRQMMSYQKKIENEFRCLTLLYYLYFPDRFKEFIARRMLLDYIRQSLMDVKGTSELLYFCIKGFKSACEQIECLGKD